MSAPTRRSLLQISGSLLASELLAGCLGSQNTVDGSSLPFMQSSTDINYNIINKNQSRQSDSVKVIRCSITTDPPVTRLSKIHIKKVAKNVLYDVLDYGRNKVNAVKIFYLTEAEVPESESCATVEWAPNGDFSQVSQVDTGNYSIDNFDFNISKNPQLCQLVE